MRTFDAASIILGGVLHFFVLFCAHSNANNNKYTVLKFAQSADIIAVYNLVEDFFG